MNPDLPAFTLGNLLLMAAPVVIGVVAALWPWGRGKDE